MWLHNGAQASFRACRQHSSRKESWLPPNKKPIISLSLCLFLPLTQLLSWVNWSIINPAMETMDKHTVCALDWSVFVLSVTRIWSTNSSGHQVTHVWKSGCKQRGEAATVEKGRLPKTTETGWNSVLQGWISAPGSGTCPHSWYPPGAHSRPAILLSAKG